MTMNASGRRVLNDELAALLTSPLCPAGRIETLLGEAQDRGAKVNKTAATKAILVSENLRRAVAEGAIPIDDVYHLLRDAEEHDSQYHYFYEVRDDSIAGQLATFESVGTAMFGVGWKTTQQFPHFLAKPQGESWGDFRQEFTGEVEAGWMLKLYSGNTRWVLDPDESQTTAAKRIRVWLPQYRREVWLIRWHRSANLLELCIPRLGNRKDQLQAKQAMFVHVEELVGLDQLEDFVFDDAAGAILHNFDQFKEEVHLAGSARLMSADGGSTVMTTRTSEQGLLDAPDRRAAIRHFRTCHELCMFWQPTTATDAVADEVKAVTGHWGARNSILFPSKNSGKAVRHVTRRLIELETRGRAAASHPSPDPEMG